MRRILPALICLVMTGCSGQDTGIFSRRAIDLWSEMRGGDREASLSSPDGRWVLVAGPQKGLRVSGRGGDLTVETLDLVNAEVVWAPDSSGALVTASDGGNVGNYHLHVFHMKNGRMIYTDLTPVIVTRFGQPGRCYDPEDPNVAGIKWLDADRIIVAAEIMPHSNCDNMGTFKAYEFNLRTMSIIATYDQLTAKRLFRRDLGRDLRNADDACFTTPGACEIPQLHGRGVGT